VLPVRKGGRSHIIPIVTETSCVTESWIGRLGSREHIILDRAPMYKQELHHTVIDMIPGSAR
jgi:hypothetical protein